MVTTTKAIRELIDDLTRWGSGSDALQRMLEMVIPSPDVAVDLLRVALDEIPQRDFFIHVAISFLPDDAFPKLASFALHRLRARRDNRSAGSFIRDCSQQSVTSLHPHLSTVFELAPNRQSYCWPWPWRGSGKEHLAHLRKVVERDRDVDRRARAWTAMLETREAEALQYTFEQARLVGKAERRERHLHDVGFEYAAPAFLKLYTEPAYHILFPQGYLLPYQAPAEFWLNTLREHHPTWRPADSQAHRVRFGGGSPGHCACCGEGLHHLITLEPVPESLGVTGLGRLELATCLSCLGWEQPQLFYKHGDDGQPQQTGYAGARITPEFPASGLRAAEVELARLSPRWQWQVDPACSGGFLNVHRVGGHPCWMEGADYPLCPACGKRMLFLLQIGSGLPTARGGEWMWGDGGICYSFWCDGCKVSGHLWQCS